MKRDPFGVTFVVVALLAACSSDGASPAPVGTGGTSAGAGGHSAGNGGNTATSEPSGGSQQSGSGGGPGSGGAGSGGDTAAGSGGRTVGSGGTAIGTGGMAAAGSGGRTAGSGGTAIGTGGMATAGIGGSAVGSGGTTIVSGGTATASGGASATGGAPGTAGTPVAGAGGRSATGGASGSSGAGGVSSAGGTQGTGGVTVGGSGGSSAGSCSGPIATFSGPVSTGIAFKDTDGKAVNAHGGGIIQVGDTFYMHGEYFPPGQTDNNFHGVEMYSSKDLATWKNEGIILEEGAGPEIATGRKGERPHIIKCPSTGEFVLYMHAASNDYQTDKEVVYATSKTVNGKYAYKGPLTNASGARAEHSDMSALVDKGKAYVITESGHVFTLADNCHSWLTDQAFSAVNIPSNLGLDKPGGGESPTVFRAGDTLY